MLGLLIFSYSITVNPKAREPFPPSQTKRYNLDHTSVVPIATHCENVERELWEREWVQTSPLSIKRRRTWYWIHRSFLSHPAKCILCRYLSGPCLNCSGDWVQGRLQSTTHWDFNNLNLSTETEIKKTRSCHARCRFISFCLSRITLTLPLCD